MRLYKWFLPFLLLASVASWAAKQELASQAVKVRPASEPTESRFAFSLTTPTLSLEELPGSEGGESGSFKIEIEGFGASRSRPGAPSIPTKTFLVAIPFGVEPTLVVRPGAEQLRPGIRPAPVPTPGHAVDPRFERAGELSRANATEARRRDLLIGSRAPRLLQNPDFYETESTQPAQVAWLGETGILRSQRYVEVHVAPVRYDPSIDGLRVLNDLQIEVRFPGAERGLGSPILEPRFEPIYRQRFVNYQQGTLFRREARRSKDLAPATPTAAAATQGGGGPRFRIRVHEHGIHRLDYNLLLSSGILAHNISDWRLSNRGNVIGLQINDGDSNDLLGPGEWVQFYGQALDDEPKTELDTDFQDPFPDIYAARDYSDENIYFLSVEATPQAPMTERESAPAVPVRTPETDFEATIHREIDNRFAPAGPADPWVWLPIQNAGNGNTSLRTEFITLPGLYSGTEPVRVRLELHGFTNFNAGTEVGVPQTHPSLITLRTVTGTFLESDAGANEGRNAYIHDFTWPGTGGPMTGTARVDIEMQPVAGAFLNESILDWVEILYSRKFEVDSESLVFDWPDEDTEFLVTGLTDPSPAIYEITPTPGSPTIQPVRLISALEAPDGMGKNGVRFRVDDDPGIVDLTPRRFVVSGGSAILEVLAQDFEVDTVSDLRSNAHQADMIVIAHPDLLDPSGTPAPECSGAAPFDCLNELLDFRATTAGGGLTTKVVSLTDVEDEFNNGLKGAGTLREFLRWVMSDAPGEGWAAPKPAYVMLIGDASYDSKNETASGNYMPTQMMFRDAVELGHYASDNVMAMVVGADRMPDLIISRIASRSVAETNRILFKILAHQTETSPTSWSAHSLFISDRGANPLDQTVGEALDFENTNETALGALTGGPYTGQHLRYWSDYVALQMPVADVPGPIRTDLVTMLNGGDVTANGAAVVQFIGHGAYQVWSNAPFLDERNDAALDTDLFTNFQLGAEPRLPWVLAHNCLTGGFHACPETGVCTVYDDVTMGENWMSRDEGGAMAVFAPSGLSFNFIGDDVSGIISDSFYGPNKQREIGRIVLNVLTDLCVDRIEPCQSYTLQGDPASTVALPSVDPAKQALAVGGNAQVSLTWDPSNAPGATYDVYRREDSFGATYQKVTVAPVALTSFTDTTAVNAVTYQYFIVALDAQGFESPWSNFNSDCDISGPDCVEATPLNPNPPSIPNGLTVSDPGVGSILNISWNPNPENDIGGYVLHYGLSSGVYTQSVSLSATPTTNVAGLVEGVPYYFAVAAENTSGVVSGLSAEASDYPAFALGLRSPAYVGDLEVDYNGADIELSWSEITTDIYGKPVQVQSYEILRGDPPVYQNSSLVPVGSCPAPCTSFTDPGANLLEEIFYRVRALDTIAGNASPLGAKAPGIVDLEVNDVPGMPGQVEVTWPAVTETVDGEPLDLLHYLIYASDTPFTREDIRDGIVSPLNMTTLTTIVLNEPAQDRYYAVLAVDIRGNVSPY